MQTSKKTQDQQLIEQLCIRFQRKPRKCKKKNDSGIGYSERIVCVSNNRFQYYPKIQEFNDLDFDKLQYVVPKAGIILSEILELKFPPRRNNDRNYFTITIPNNKILKYTKTLKEMVTDENAEGQQQWTFIFDYDIISLPEYQKRLEFMKQLQIQKLSTKKRNQQLQIARKEQQIIKRMNQQYQSLMQTEKIMSQKQGDPSLKRKNLQGRENEAAEKTLNQADQFYFHEAYIKLCKGSTNQAQLMELQLDVLEAIGKFRKRAEKVVRKYIDQLPYALNSSVDTIKIIDNLLLKIGTSKHLNLQFLDNLQVAHAIYVLRKRNQNKIRVPLCTFIKYKGLKILVRAMTPCDNMNQKQKQENFLHGNFVQNWKTHFFLVDDLNIILQSLNLKPYNSELYFQRVVIHLGTRLQLISTKADPFYYVKSLAERQYPQSLKQKVLYAFNISQVFPIDLDLQKNIKQDDVRLRPQYVRNYKQTPNSKQLTKLVGGALTYEYEDEEGSKDDLALARASQNLKYTHLMNFVQCLDKLQYVPMTSQHLKNITKQNGINIRYFSTIYKLTSLPYIRQMITIQVIAREVKKIYRDYQKDFIIEVFRKSHNDKIKEIYDKNSKNSFKVMKTKQLQRKQKQKSIQNSIDFLNLIFGNGQQSQQFWQIIKTKVKQNYKIQIQQHTDLSHGYLLMTILYHCGFGIKLNSNLLLFAETNPFSAKDWIEFRSRSQCFTYPSFQVYKKCKITQDLTEQAIISRLELNLFICRALGADQSKILTELASYTGNTQIRPKQKYTVQTLKYFVSHASKQNFQAAYDIITFVLPSSHPFFQDFYLQYAALKTSDSVILKKAAESHAIRTLGISHWKTSSILSGFKQQAFLRHLITAQAGTDTGKKIELYHKIAKEQSRIGKFSDCFEYVRRAIAFVEKKGYINVQQQEQLFRMLMIGMEVTYKLRKIKDLMKISQYFWAYLQEYRMNVDSHQFIQSIIYYSLKGYLQSNQRKYYLFKIVLILEQKIKKQKPIKKQVLLKNLRQKCRQSKNHQNWFNQLFNKLQFAYTQINFLPDFFTNFEKHVKKMQSQQLEEGLEELTLLIRLFHVSYFEEALLDRAYTFQRESQWEIPQKKEANVKK